MKTEIRRVYGLYEVYVDGVFAKQFIMLYSAKEYVAAIEAIEQDRASLI